jgi:putative peptide zinc metalloprotease protein
VVDATQPTATRTPLSLALVLPDGRRVTLCGPITIGRGEEADVRIPDRTVSRVHAKITVGPDGPLLEDAGSRFGTQLGGSLLTRATPLRAGAEIRLGDVTITIERDVGRPDAVHDLPREAGETLVVPVDATLLGLRPASPNEGSLQPRVRSGWALKRLEAEEGGQRFLLRDLRGGAFMRMDASDAALFELIDGKRTVLELLQAAERTVGPAGPARLACLIADLSERGLLANVGARQVSPQPTSRLAQILKPHERSVESVGDYFERAYRRWGRLLFAPLAATTLALLALAGFGTFMYIVGARYGTPFVVANRLVIGGAVFILGRLALVVVHEVAHGIALTHYGRRAVRGGLRLILIFPFAFVDTSESYFESRSHRIVISAAGPASDLTMGAVLSLACAAAPRGSLRDVFFQLAFGAYVGAFFNLNPFLDRDGYNILVDFLREPRLRQRARVQLAQKLSGARRDEQMSPVLARYAIAGLIWTTLGAAAMIIFSTRYYHQVEALAPRGLIVTVFIVFCLLLLLPVLAQLGLPIWRRLRYGTAEVNRVIR